MKDAALRLARNMVFENAKPQVAKYLVRGYSEICQNIPAILNQSMFDRLAVATVTKQRAQARVSGVLKGNGTTPDVLKISTLVIEYRLLCAAQFDAGELLRINDAASIPEFGEKTLPPRRKQCVVSNVSNQHLRMFCETKWTQKCSVGYAALTTEEKLQIARVTWSLLSRLDAPLDEESAKSLAMGEAAYMNEAPDKIGVWWSNKKQRAGKRQRL